MMATEATTENAGTPSILHDNELNKTETPIQDVPAESSTVNGNSEGDGTKKDSEQEPVDGITNSAEVSVSGGSDTEASKTAKTQADEKGHGRTTSTVKKFASFKPVSVNKTFLASKGAAAAAPSKLGDKGNTGTTTTPVGPTATLTARPRLVAKTGSGLGTSTPRSSATANGGKPGGAPDGNAVWNKNRPAPPPEQKRFTDEELKQRYGIHMATRLESDKEGKQANWADIDDDDDDWAPETIEWTDGTKVALPQQADEVVPREPTPEPEPIPAVKEIKPLEATKPQSPAPAQPTPSPTIKTGGFGNGRAGLVLKGAAEKPTLVAKPPGPPTPVKSPWAPLPPVDKVAPVSIEIPQNQQQQPSRFGQRDPHGFQNMPPPAKEIAADDFSRSWRENGPSTNRELYNSQSGRYEPVNDNRRGNTRSDPHARQPAVLQRPTQQEHPEPSAAFQTHRSGQDTSYGRRRTSSNVSGGSGLLRRMSRGHDLPPPHELLNARRGSLAAVSDAPSSPRNFSPSGQHPNQRGYRVSPVTSHPSPHPVAGHTVPPNSDGVHMPVQPIPGFPTQEDVEEQKRLMREKREAAIQRRKDEEAKEEAARKERIRLKLEAMGPAPESKSKQKDVPKDEKLSVPTQIQTRDSTSALPTPESLKVKASEAEATPIPNSLEHKKIESPPQSLKSRVNGDHSAGPPTSTSQEGRGPQPWQNAPPSSTERYNSWGSAHPPQQRSVWGPPPSNDKTLGNGTFNPELSRMPEMHQGSSNPGPIAPPTANRVNGNGHYPPSRGRDQYESRPGPIAPPNRQQGFPRPDPQNRAQQVAAWNSLPEKLAQEDALLVQQQAEELGRRRALQEAGLAPEISQPVFKDTWRQVHLNEDGSRTAVQANITTMHNEQPVTSPTWNQSEQSGNRHEVNHPQFNETWRRSGVDNSTINSGSLPGMNASPPVRNSRFFPNRDVRLEDPNVSFERPGSPSPPPPTMAGHPVYDGDAAHPHVSFPRPPPIVKLPPVLAPIGPPKPTKPATFAAAIAAPAPPPAIPIRQGAPARGNANQEAVRPSAGGWQDKINSLIGRKTPPKSHALAVDSSSKNALELPNSQFAATVSFPTATSGSTVDETVATKPAAEECFEEQEMGSLPVVRVPHKAPELAWNIAPPPKSIPKKFLVSHITTVGDLNFSLGNTIMIMLPGQTEGKSVYAPTLLSQRQKSNPRRRGGASRSASSAHPRGGRARDSQGGFPSPSPDHASTSSTPTSGRGSGSYRGRGGHSGGNPWTNPRHVSTPVHT